VTRATTLGTSSWYRTLGCCCKERSGIGGPRTDLRTGRPGCCARSAPADFVLVIASALYKDRAGRRQTRLHSVRLKALALRRARTRTLAGAY